MAPQDELEHYEATEAQDLTRLLRALRPPARAVQVPTQVDITIRAEIWKAQALRQMIMLLPMARRELVQVIRQALMDNPMLEEVPRAENECTPADKEHAHRFMESANNLTEGQELYDGIWQECVPNDWASKGLPSQASAEPGSRFTSTPSEAIVPDVIVMKVENDYQVFLNDEGIPRLRISAVYRRMLREGKLDEPDAKHYLEDKLRSAVWLIRSLEQRRQTLDKVAHSLVTCQREFLDHGLAHLKPLALTEVADAIGMHESTVRRVITNKYLATAHGLVALTSFFPSDFESAGGESRSSLMVTETQQFMAEEMEATRRQQGGSAALWAGPAAGTSRLSPDEEQRVRQALFRHWQAEPPLLERHVRELQALYEIGQALCSVHDLDHLLQLAIERVVTLLNIQSASIILLDAEHDELYFAKVADDSRIGPEQHVGEVRFPRFPAKQGIAGWVIHEGQSQIVLDVDQDPRWYREVDVQTGTKTRSIMCAPLRTKDRIIGVLEAINKIQGVFTIEDVRLLEAFGNQLALAIENARLIQELQAAQERLSEENRYWREAIAPTVQFETLVGESPRMQYVYRLVERVLNTTAYVLLTGESGTGKDMIARVLHFQGPRAKGPFIAVNCAAIPENLLEAELFGYERGAFTGATQRKPGRFELAAGGTLFLNEIGDMSPVLQAKLLQVLQDKQFERLGGTETLTTDARIVAATNQDLERLMTEGRFRPDLFHRLNVYPIALPPLRERQEDLSPLTMFFLRRFSQELRKEVLGISKEAMGLLERYSWPGNVRELENVIQRAVILAQGTVVTAQDLPSLRENQKAPVLSGEAFRLPSGGIVLADLEKSLIQQALEHSHQNKSRAAVLLGFSRTQLRTRMRHYSLE